MGMGGVLAVLHWEILERQLLVNRCHPASQDNEEPPALPPRTPEGFQMEEEPVYEEAPEPEPEPEPENDYEDVGEMDRHEPDEEPEGDYEDVLEPEDPSFSSTLAGEWWGSSWIWSAVGERKRENSPITQKDLSIFLLHVDETIFIFLIMQDHQAARLGLGLGSQL